MKGKLVLVGEAWRIDKQFMALAVYFHLYDTSFTRSVDAICDNCIPDFKDWGPAEVYFQNPDYARPGGIHNIGKNGITICHSQMYDKTGRDINDLSKQIFNLVVATLQKFKLLPMQTQVFSEAHVSDENGKSYFIEIPAIWT